MRSQDIRFMAGLLTYSAIALTLFGTGRLVANYQDRSFFESFHPLALAAFALRFAYNNMRGFNGSSSQFAVAIAVVALAYAAEQSAVDTSEYRLHRFIPQLYMAVGAVSTLGGYLMTQAANNAAANEARRDDFAAAGVELVPAQLPEAD